MKTKLLVLGAFFSILAALLQCAPVIFSESLTIVTILSSLPIYIATRTIPKIGFCTYLVAAVLIGLLSMHESLFFLCTNGIIALSLGFFTHYNYGKTITSIASAIVMTSTISLINFGIGIPIFYAQLPGSFLIQLGIILLFSLIYCSILHSLLEFTFIKLNKYYKL